MSQTFAFHYKKKNLKLGKKTIVMGVLNITPDSFSDGGIYFYNITNAVKRAEEMVLQGARIIDIGGESTRPQSTSVSIDEELRRVIPVIQAVRKRLGKDIFISVDTYKAKVAQLALKSGADIINSLRGFSFDKDLADVVRKFQCPIIIYHIKGVPKTMQTGTISYEDVVDDIKHFLEEQIALGISQGIKKEQFLIDPGIGFGKTVTQNIEIIQRLKEFQSFHVPLVIGISRKSHLGLLLQKDMQIQEMPSPLERVEASLAETAVAVWNGAQIVRTHDVLETKKFLIILDRLKQK